MLFILIRYFPVVLFLGACYYWRRSRKLNLPEKTQKIYGWIVIGMLVVVIVYLLALGFSQ